MCVRKDKTQTLARSSALTRLKMLRASLPPFNQLVGVIGGHVTVFGPLLTLLLQRLMGSQEGTNDGAIKAGRPTQSRFRREWGSLQE
jgi:hypothetical protein